MTGSLITALRWSTFGKIARFMVCNRCHGPLLPDQLVEPSFSGLHPYVHSEPADCPALREELQGSGPPPPARRLREIEGGGEG